MDAKELTAEELFLQKYGNKITASESWVIRFADDYATLRTQSLQDKVNELEGENKANRLFLKDWETKYIEQENELSHSEFENQKLEIQIDSLQSALTESKLREERLVEELQSVIRHLEDAINTTIDSTAYSYYYKVISITNDLLSSNQPDPSSTATD